MPGARSTRLASRHLARAAEAASALARRCFLPSGARRRAGHTLAALLLLAPFWAQAAIAPEDMLKDPAQEARAREIGRELRCMVCQNQSIEDSDAGLARDLRLIVREQVAAGRSDSDIVDYIHARYGDFVLLRPPFNASTALLWGSPLLVLLIGGGLILALRRGRGATTAPAPLTSAEKARLATLEAEIAAREKQ
ncbi:cytochrome c-type biogenesis protein CcmH [Acetobacteraceae bacterium H6797]|nr:cytochrome c-type biogenesis protein CcmH [Acetobacteraceae bacterium H6797]